MILDLIFELGNNYKQLLKLYTMNFVDKTGLNIILISLLCLSLINFGYSTSNIIEEPPKLNYTQENPISITGDSNFASFANNHNNISGDGSEGNPYLISGFNITTDSQDLIDLNDITTHYIVIEDSYFNSVDQSNHGISINNVTNIEIRNNIFINNLNGIFIKSSSNFLILKNDFSKITNNAVSMQTSNGSVVEDNIFHDIEGQSFTLARDVEVLDSDHITIRNNIAHQTDESIGVENSNNIEIYNNFINSSEQGIKIDSSQYIDIYDNEINDTSLVGIFIQSTQHLSIETNNLTNIDNDGIFLTGTSSSNATILDNILDKVGQKGIDIRDASDISIINNSLTYIDWDGIYSSSAEKINITGNYLNHIEGEGVFLRLAGDVANKINSNTILDVLENGIRVYFTHNIDINSNSIKITKPQYAGIIIDSSANSTIIGNSMNIGGVAIVPRTGSESGFEYTSIEDHIVTEFDNNTINGQDIGYFSDIENLHLNGNTQSNFAQIIAYNVSNVHIEDYSLSETYLGIGIYFSGNISVNNNFISNVGRSGIEISQANNVTVTNNQVDSSTEGGIIMSYTDQVLIANNNLKNIGTSGDSDQREESGVMIAKSSNVDIKSNEFMAILANAISVYNSENTTITNNQFSSITAVSIGLDAIKNMLIKDNFGVDMSRAVSIASDSFESLDIGENITIVDNIFRDIENIGYNLPQVDNSIISNNVLANIDKRAIYLNDPTNVTITNNYMINAEINLLFMDSPTNVSVTNNIFKSSKSTYLVYIQGSNSAGTTNMVSNDFIGDPNQVSTSLAFSSVDISVSQNYWSNHDDSGNYQLDGGENEDTSPQTSPLNPQPTYSISNSGHQTLNASHSGITIFWETNFMGTYQIYLNNKLIEDGITQGSNRVKYQFTNQSEGDYIFQFVAVAPTGETLANSLHITVKTSQSTGENTTIVSNSTQIITTNENSANLGNIALAIVLAIIITSPFTLVVLSQRF